MSRVVRLRSQEEIDREAAAWTWRLDAGTPGAAERAEFESWLRRDARHRRAFEDLRKTWDTLDRLSEAKRDEKIAALAWATRRMESRLSAGQWAAAAAVFAVMIGTAWWIGRAAGTRVYATAVGQERRVRLADGSVVALNTQTRIEVRYSHARRDIYLLQGEAHFHDTHEADRPFFVHAGGALVQAIGTQFEVRLHADRRIEVLVNQGRVEVRDAGSSASSARFDPFARMRPSSPVRALAAGQQLSMDGLHVKVISVSSRQIADDLAWRYGALVFDNEPLSQAVAEVGRYTPLRIMLRGPGVADLRISGRFRTSDVPGFFKALATALPVEVHRSGSGLIVIQARR